MTTLIKKRRTSTIPFGWSLHPKNDKILIEDDLERDTLTTVAEELEATQSLRQMCRYIQAHTGRELSPRGLQLILKKRKEEQNERDTLEEERG